MDRLAGNQDPLVVEIGFLPAIRDLLVIEIGLLRRGEEHRVATAQLLEGQGHHLATAKLLEGQGHHLATVQLLQGQEHHLAIDRLLEGKGHLLVTVHLRHPVEVNHLVVEAATEVNLLLGNPSV